MSELVRSVGLLSFQQLVLMVLGATRTKVAAALLGPSGMGLLAQATAFQDLIRQISMLGSANGFLKLVAEARGRDDRRALSRLIVTAAMLFGGLGLAVGILCVADAPALSQRVFHDAAHANLIVLVSGGMLFAIAGLLVARVFSGSLQFHSYVQMAIFDSAVALVGMVALAALYGLGGAVASLVLADVAALGFGGFLLWRRVVRPLGLDLRPRAPDPATVKQLVRFAGALSLTSLTAAGAAVFVRAEIIRQFGSEANGFYQVAWQVGQNYLGILGTSLWTYGMPKVASKLDQADVVLGLQNDFLRIALGVMAPGIVLLLCTRELWVPLLYTRAFLAAGGMLCWQLGGELVAMLRQSMNISLLPRERLGFLVFQAVLYWGGWAVLSVLLLPRLGAVAVALAYCAANLLALVATYAYHRTALGYRVRADNVTLLLVTLPAFALAVAFTAGQASAASRAVPLAVVLFWLAWNRRLYVEGLEQVGLLRAGRRG
jgi:PST family polysaccharide transporter